MRDFAKTFRESEPRLDVVIHNAGTLSRDYQRSAQGIELTVATQLIAPFVLATELLALLLASAPSRVVTVSSGGMYTQRHDLARLEMTSDAYDGVTAYARAKRAQLVLNRVGPSPTRFGDRVSGHAPGLGRHARHPDLIAGVCKGDAALAAQRGPGSGYRRLAGRLRRSGRLSVRLLARPAPSLGAQAALDLCRGHC